MRKYLLLFIPFIIFLSCSDYKPESFGPYREIIVFGDKELGGKLKNVLQQTFERKTITPQDEKEFYLRWVDSLGLQSFSKARNIIFIATLDSPDNISSWVINNLSDEAMQSVKTYDNYIFLKENVWAKNQMVLFFVAPTVSVLASDIAFSSRRLFNIVDSLTDERVKGWIFSSAFGEGEDYELERKIMDDFNFGIRVPKGFWADEYLPDQNFLWLRAVRPESWVFVYYQDNLPEDSLNYEWWIRKRNWIGKKWYEGDSVVRNSLTFTRAQPFGLPGLKIRGLWENSKKVQGGPLISYLFYDPTRGRVYIVDGALYSPGAEKTPYLRHIRIVMKSFDDDTTDFKAGHPKFGDE